jgi:hypothetical protein
MITTIYNKRQQNISLFILITKIKEEQSKIQKIVRERPPITTTTAVAYHSG